MRTFLVALFVLGVIGIAQGASCRFATTFYSDAECTVDAGLRHPCQEYALQANVCSQIRGSYFKADCEAETLTYFMGANCGGTAFVLDSSHCSDFGDGTFIRIAFGEECSRSSASPMAPPFWL
ncbi:hypothetical protein QOT17_005539 [Balamuthia mandrillaris]